MADVTKFQDVHQFDGKLQTLKIKPHIPESDKRKMFEDLTTKISQNRNIPHPQSVHGLHVVISDMGSPRNYDPTNDMYADDILAEICSLLQIHFDPDIINNIIETIAIQIVDMLQLGQCAQGRVNRLLQIYRFVKEIRDITPVGLYFSFVENTPEIKVNIVAY